MKVELIHVFVRHGGWLTFGNLDLHLIKGRPCVHEDDDLIVGHLAVVVSDMAALKEHLKKKGILYRTNISVPNPDDQQTGRADQAFVRDPDGYYIEFCNCNELDNFLHRKQAENVSLEEQLRRKHSVSSLNSVLKYGNRLHKLSQEAKVVVQHRNWEVGYSYTLALLLF